MIHRRTINTRCEHLCEDFWVSKSILSAWLSQKKFRVFPHFFVKQQKNFLGRFQISLECEAEDKPDKN